MVLAHRASSLRGQAAACLYSASVSGRRCFTAALLNLQSSNSRSRESPRFLYNVVVATRDRIWTRFARSADFPRPPNSSAVSDSPIADVSSAASLKVKAVIAGAHVIGLKRHSCIVPSNGEPLHIRKSSALWVPKARSNCVCNLAIKWLLKYSAGRSVPRRSYVALGDETDNQIRIDLSTAQHLANLPGRSVLFGNCVGTPREIQNLHHATYAENSPTPTSNGLRQFRSRIQNLWPHQRTANRHHDSRFGSHLALRHGCNDQRRHGAQNDVG